MGIYIVRNNQDYGPYDYATIVSYVKNGQILKCDKARDSISGEINSVGYFLRKSGHNVKVDRHKGLVSQLKNIGTELIIPKSSFTKSQLLSDKRLLTLALIGLVPSMIMLIPLGGFMTFYLISLYFAVIWGLFFYYLFKTPQVDVKTTLITFFVTQFIVFVLWVVLGLPSLNPFYLLVDTFFPLNALGYIFGVGFTEELVKLLPLLIICYRAKEPQIPQTLVYYGLMSGIAFGVFEGVQYQMGINAEQEYTTAYYLNILRLTSLPFIHAVWCGIAGYFISFASLYPKYRVALYFLAISIPALLHGLYDTFCGNTLGFLIAFPIMFATVILLNTYLKQGVNYQSKLRN